MPNVSAKQTTVVIPSALGRLPVSTAAGILLAVGIVKCGSILGTASILKIQDPIFSLQFRYLMPIVGFLEIAVAILILRGNRPVWESVMILSLAIEFLIYRFFSMALAPGGYCPCFGSLGEALGLNGAATRKLGGFIIFLLVGLALIPLTACFIIKWNRRVSTER
ncbi:MAG: hypothetical protein MN733_12495 [Nitrososphaera sp.]|nr:hypothetical protein [Nitrososphaera sp.]